jgi:long-chain acyl-CoA synthetase
MSSEQRVLSLLPLHHFYPLVGCVLAPLISGATVVISRNFMPRSILKTIDNLKVDRLTAVPSIYVLLLQHYRKNEYNLSSLTCSLTGGAYMPFEVQASIKTQMGLEVIQGYGLTECFVVTWNQHEYSQSGTLGLPFRQDVQIRIMGDNGECRYIKEVGEIAVKTPTIMQGYYDRREETKSVLREGWLYTGDYGYLDEKQYLYFSGLKKNITKVGGNIVDLKEVQNVLLSHPAILDAIVHPQEDDLWGHVVATEIVLHRNCELTEKEVKDFCGRMLSRYKIPRMIKFTRGS